MIRFAALFLLLGTSIASAQPKVRTTDLAKPGDEIPKSVGKAGDIEVFVQPFVSNSVEFTDFKFEKNKITCIAVYKRGVREGIRFDFYDADNVRASFGWVNPEELVEKEKVRLSFPITKPAESKTLKITRDFAKKNQ